MSDINDAAHPEWRQLCQAVLFEPDPTELVDTSQDYGSDKMAISQRLVDPSRTIRVLTRYSWQDSYRAALLETDWTRMVELVQAAESEIHKRRLELSQDHNGTQEEREAVVNALNGLRVLRMDAAAWRERQNLK